MTASSPAPPGLAEKRLGEGRPYMPGRVAGGGAAHKVTVDRNAWGVVKGTGWVESHRGLSTASRWLGPAHPGLGRTPGL